MRGWGGAGWSFRGGGLGAYRANPGEAVSGVGVGVGVSIFSRGCCPSPACVLGAGLSILCQRLCSQSWRQAEWVPLNCFFLQPGYLAPRI